MYGEIGGMPAHAPGANNATRPRADIFTLTRVDILASLLSPNLAEASEGAQQDRVSPPGKRKTEIRADEQVPEVGWCRLFVTAQDKPVESQEIAKEALNHMVLGEEEAWVCCVS